MLNTKNTEIKLKVPDLSNLSIIREEEKTVTIHKKGYTCGIHMVIREFKERIIKTAHSGNQEVCGKRKHQVKSLKLSLEKGAS